ncbi:MAG: hypothetical protein ACYDBB_11900 [Armatimonadota bacterium]
MKSFTVVCVLLFLISTAIAQAPKPKDELALFTLREAFGVAHPEQLVAFDLATPVDATQCYLLGPDGAEATYQVVDGGRKLAVRTHLPASRMLMHRDIGGTCEEAAKSYKFDTKGVEKMITTDGPFFSLGDVVQVDGTTLPDGLSRKTNYYVTKLEFRDVKGWGFHFIGLSPTLGGEPIPILKSGKDAYLISQALVADPNTDQLYIRAHRLVNGVPITFRTHGELPQPLQPGVAYYVCNASPDTFRISTERGGKPIDLLTPGSGIHELLIDWTWTLKSGRAPKAATDGVKVTQMADANLWEITNGKVGIRIPKSQTPDNARKVLSPVQGVQLADDRWVATAPNAVTFTPGTQVKKVTANLVENGPLKVVVELTYELDRAQFTNDNTVVYPAGPGTYACRIELQAGQPSVLFEEETDCAFSYNIDLKGLTLNQARFRPHRVSDPKLVWRPDGKPAEKRLTDAFFDLPFDKNYASGYVTSLDQSAVIHWMQPWNPWSYDTGTYWMLYDKTGADATPLIGYYDGCASRLRDASAVGVGVYTRQDRSTGITVQAWQRAANNRILPNPRWQWRLFIGSKGADMRDWRAVQPINQQMNVHSGIGLNKIAQQTTEFAEPVAGFGATYMKKEAMTDVVRRLREDNRYYREAYRAVPSPASRETIDMIRDDSGVLVRQIAATLWRDAHDNLNKLVNGEGIIGGNGFTYWHAGLAGNHALMRIDQILASDKATATDKALAKQVAVFYATVLWDNDHVPLFGEAKVNLGTANMPIQQQGYRDMYALFLATHPMMKDRTGGVWERARNMVQRTINEHGAHMGSTHYISAANGPLLSTLQQLKQAGIIDPFREEPRLKKYAEFEMNFCTPVDPRYGKRVRPAIGNAPAGEATEFLGMLATGFADVDPELSARLMGAWQQSGKSHSDFHSATIFKIDDRLPAVDPKLTSAHFEGWYSVLRFGWNTPNETATWFVNGDWYRDHAECDLGETVIYALGAPLSLDFGTMYSPVSSGGFVHSVVLPEAKVGDWKQNPPDLMKGPRWKEPHLLDFQSRDREAWSTASFTMGGTVWTRTVKTAMVKDDLPVISIRDMFTTDSKVFLLNLMNEGAVITPDGEKNVGDSFSIPVGVTKLHYTGQQFAKHPAGGIDWDLYVIADAPQEAFIAEYAHDKPKPERQSILRLKGTGAFQVVIVAYRKGTTPGVTLTQQLENVVVTAGAAQAVF